MNLLNWIKANRRLILSSAGMVALSLILFVSVAWQRLNSALEIEGAVIYTVPPGASMSRVTDDLEELGYLSDPFLLKSWSRLNGTAAQIKAGEYEILPQTTPMQLLGILVAGAVKQYPVTLVEGWTVAQALEAIWSSHGIIATLQSLDPQQLAEALNLEHSNPEGLFFPDTYFYSGQTTDREILLRANNRLNTVLDQEWSERLGALPFATPYEALILASIVEKETSDPSERNLIAGVFIRRLETGMRLQSDPTVIYGMGQQFDGNIRREALQTVTPYNTYRVNGLPPTPIALAGREAIVATLNPAPTEFLYFVSKGDGSHYFSETLEEHNDAVRRFQIEPQN